MTYLIFVFLGLRKGMLEKTTLKHSICGLEQANADSYVHTIILSFFKIHP